MRSKKNLYLTILAILVLVLGMLGSLFLSEGIAERVISVITAVTAVVGAVALFYQFRRDKSLHEANFLVEYSNQFYSTYDCADLMNELEKSRNDPTYRFDTEAYYQRIVGIFI